MPSPSSSPALLLGYSCDPKANTWWRLHADLGQLPSKHTGGAGLLSGAMSVAIHLQLSCLERWGAELKERRGW